MTDNRYYARRWLMSNTYGGRPGIDLEVSGLKPNQLVVYDGTNDRLYGSRRNNWRQGVSLGGAAGLATFNAYAAWLSNYDLIASDFCSDAAWSDIENPQFIFDAWVPWQKAYPQHWLSLAVHILPSNLWTDGGASLSTGASGGFDAHFNTLGDNIVASGLKNLIIRLDHEFNLHQIANAANWVTYWKRVVNLLRAKFTAASGVTAYFCWNFSYNASKPPGTTTANTLDDLWPGGFTQATGTGSIDAVTLLKYPFRRRWGCPEVDFVGIDVYDNSPGNGLYTPGTQPTRAQQHGAWASYLTNFNEFQSPPGDLSFVTGSMEYAAALARESNTPLCVPEWGCWSVRPSGEGVSSGGDNPIFVRKMHEWCRLNSVAFASYFDVTLPTFSAYHQLWPGLANNFTTDFPQARDEFLRLF